jgi:hypothetical protein
MCLRMAVHVTIDPEVRAITILRDVECMSYSQVLIWARCSEP